MAISKMVYESNVYFISFWLELRESMYASRGAGEMDQQEVLSVVHEDPGSVPSIRSRTQSL